MIKFSIITISYNSARTIERTILSVLGQTYKKYEYNIIDGGSKDGTLDIIKRYEPLFNGRMKWISEPDNGIYNAMNKGIRMSTGDIVGIVNSDDWLEPDALEQVEKMASMCPDSFESIYCGSLRFHYEDGTEQLMETDEGRFNEGMKHGSMNHGAYHPSMFVGRKVYQKEGLFDEKFRVIADADFIRRCFNAGVNFYFTKAVINNMSDGGVSNKMNLKIRVPDKIYECTKNGYGVLSTCGVVVKYIFLLSVRKIIPDKWIKIYRKNKR